MGPSRFSDLRIEPIRVGPLKLFSVDLEDWFHSNFRSLGPIDEGSLPRRVEAGLDRLLEALAGANARATFFVLGEVAVHSPAAVRRIADAGHEIGCHGLTHALLYEQPKARVIADVDRARKLLQDQSGQDVLGFRAPSWSVTERNLWALDVLSEAGFVYDSSIFPAKTHLYGIPSAPRTPYRLTTPSGARLIEIPPSTLSLGRFRIGVGGGVYLRVLPLWVQRLAMASARRRRAPFVAYTHPREFDPGAWNLRLPLSLYETLIHRVGLPRGMARLGALLERDGPWCPISEVLHHTRAGLGV